jgi:hypothetical protein
MLLFFRCVEWIPKACCDSFKWNSWLYFARWWVDAIVSIIIVPLITKYEYTTTKYDYNIAFIFCKFWTLMAKSHFDITQCQHGTFISLYFFVLYYKKTKTFFPYWYTVIAYHHSWKLGKLEIVRKHSALGASCFHTISLFTNFHSCWYLTIIRWRLGDYRGIFAETKSRWIFPDNHRAWGE